MNRKLSDEVLLRMRAYSGHHECVFLHAFKGSNRVEQVRLHFALLAVNHHLRVDQVAFTRVPGDAADIIVASPHSSRLDSSAFC